jgi:hypothetical protein
MTVLTCCDWLQPAAQQIEGLLYSARPRNPIRGSLVRCCARTANGHVAAAPATTDVIKSRRLIRVSGQVSFEC